MQNLHLHTLLYDFVQNKDHKLLWPDDGMRKKAFECVYSRVKIDCITV